MQSNVQVESWHYQYRIVTTTRYSLLRFSFRKFDTLIHKSKQNSMDATLKTPLCVAVDEAGNEQCLTNFF